MDCEIEKLTKDFEVDCDNLPIGGLDVELGLVALKDIDRANTTFDPLIKLRITNFALLPGAEMVFLKGVKQTNAKSYALVKKEASIDKWRHQINGVIFNPSAENKEQLARLATGVKYVAVVNQNWKGADDEEAFEVLGYNAGLELMEATNNSAENDNTIPIMLANADNFEEPLPPYNVLEGDYGTTLTAFKNRFSDGSVSS